MARLTDDQRYALALALQERIAREEMAAFRRRVADRVIGMASTAIDEMGDAGFDEAKLRRALAGYDGMYVEEGMRYIERVLLRGGTVEAAKRVAEASAEVGYEALPEAVQQAWQELSRTGLLDEYLRQGLASGPRSQEGLTA